MLRRLRNWEMSLIDGKIRDDFIEEIVFDLCFEGRKGFRHMEVEKVQKNATEQEAARLTSQRCAYTGCEVRGSGGRGDTSGKPCWGQVPDGTDALRARRTIWNLFTKHFLSK